MSPPRWTVKTDNRTQGALFQLAGEGFFRARSEFGFGRDFELYLKRLGTKAWRPSWQVEIPDKYKTQPGKSESGINFLRFAGPHGRVSVLSFPKPVPNSLLETLEGGINA